MADVSGVPIIEVHSGNIKDLYPGMVLAIKTSTFVAIDASRNSLLIKCLNQQATVKSNIAYLELSGLGDRRQLMAKGIEERYKSVCDVARTRSLISLGISCFKLNTSPSLSAPQRQSVTLTSGNSNDNHTVPSRNESPTGISKTPDDLAGCLTGVVNNIDGGTEYLTKTTDKTGNGTSFLTNSTLGQTTSDCVATNCDRSGHIVNNGSSAADGCFSGSDLADNGVRFTVQTYNILILCSEHYVVEPHSLKFLLEHGFDFNRQYALGLPYHRGCDRTDTTDQSPQYLRDLFSHLIQSQVPIVLHNALVDIVFLYGSLYATLPPSLSSFLADCSQIFSAGVYDTKYIAEFLIRMPSSFLEYAFRKSLRENSGRSCTGKQFVDVGFLTYPQLLHEHILYFPCGLNTQPSHRDMGKDIICKAYAAHGWCQEGARCKKSHDVDLILDSEDWIITSKKKKTHRGTRAGKKCKARAASKAAAMLQSDNSGSDDDSDVDDDDDSKVVNSNSSENTISFIGALKVDSSFTKVVNSTSKNQSNGDSNFAAVECQEDVNASVGQFDIIGKVSGNGPEDGKREQVKMFVQNLSQCCDNNISYCIMHDGNYSISSCSINNSCTSDLAINGTIDTSAATSIGSGIKANVDTLSDNTSRNTNANNANSNGSNRKVKATAQQNRAVGHRAGFDAFMTGYIFSVYLMGQDIQTSSNIGPSGVQMPLDSANKVYLSGKDFPLQLVQSSYSKFSKAHMEKWNRINSLD